MKHHYIQKAEALNSSAHYGVSTNGSGDILVQVDDGTNQTRVKITLQEATHLRRLLSEAWFKAFDELFDNHRT